MNRVGNTLFHVAGFEYLRIIEFLFLFWLINDSII